MEVEVSSCVSRKLKSEKDIGVKKRTLEQVVEQCQIALQMLTNTHHNDQHGDCSDHTAEGCKETDQWCDLLKSRVECPDFLQKLESTQVLFPQNVAEEGSSWDMVSEIDLWEGGKTIDLQEEYVIVRQEDIVEGIAGFMAAYLLSLEQTKDLSPNQLQDALSKTFSLKKRKGKLQKAWDGSKVIYNVASWGATAIGIYQNPAVISAASAAFLTSFRAISKLV